MSANHPVTAPAVLVVTGASGAGKTTLVHRLAGLGIPDVACHEFDAIGIPSEAEMRARFGDGAGFQHWALGQWMTRLVHNADGARVAVLDAQVRPRAARDAFVRHALQLDRVVLVHCDDAERNARLHGPRGQPELATAQMDRWAVYLRDQADTLQVPVVDTTGSSLEVSLAALREHLDALLTAVAPSEMMPRTAE